MSQPPVRLTHRTRREAGVVFVACRVYNETSEPRKLRVRNRLDGPTLPPRRRGRPVAGWEAATYTGVVEANAVEPVGYACPTDETSEPAAALVAVGDPERPLDAGSKT